MSSVGIVMLSLTVLPPAVPLAFAVLRTTPAPQTSRGVVFFEQRYVHVSAGSSVPGVSSGPDALDLATSSGGSSQFGSVTRTEEAGKARSPMFVT
jgi:hypothetical protein